MPAYQTPHKLTKDGSFFLALARTKSIASPCQYQIKVGEGGVTHGNVLVEFHFPRIASEGVYVLMLVN